MLTKKTIFYLFLSIIMLPSVCFGWDTHIGDISVNLLDNQTINFLNRGNFESETAFRTHPYLVYKAIKLLEHKNRLPYFLMDNNYLKDVLIGSVMEDFDIEGGYDAVGPLEADFYYNQISQDNPLELDIWSKESRKGIIRFSRAFNHFYTGGFDPQKPQKNIGEFNDFGTFLSPGTSVIPKPPSEINNSIYWGLYNSKNLRGIGAINSKTSFSDLLLILGHVSHLLGDMSVPYHVYGVAHRSDDPIKNIEHWVSSFPFQKHDDVGEDSEPLNLDKIKIPDIDTFDSLFENLSRWTRRNFFCENVVPPLSSKIFIDSQMTYFEDRIIDYSYNTKAKKKNLEELTIDSRNLSGSTVVTSVSPGRGTYESVGLTLGEKKEYYVLINDNETLGGERFLAKVKEPHVKDIEQKRIIINTWEDAQKSSSIYTTEGDSILYAQTWSILRNKAIGHIARLIELYNDKYINYNTNVKTNFEKWTEIKVGEEKMGFRLKPDGIMTYNNKIFKVALGFTTSGGPGMNFIYDKVVLPEKIFISPISPTKRFVFIRADNYDYLFINLFLFDVINGKLTEVPTGKYGNDYYVMWSPDEKYAITHSENEEYTLFYRIDLNTGDTRVVDVNYFGREKNRINYYPRRSGTNELISSKNIIWKSNNRLNAIVNIKCCAMCWTPTYDSCANYDYDFVKRSYTIEVDFSKYDNHGNIIDIKTHLNPSPGGGGGGEGAK